MASILDTDLNNLMIQFIDDAFPRVLSQDHPFLDRITKVKETGRQVALPVSMGPGGGSSTNFEDALANASQDSGVQEQWQIDPQRGYGIVTFNPSDAEFTRGPESAISAYENTTKNAMIIAMEDFGGRMGLFSDGYGTLAQIDVATNTTGNIWQLTFKSPSDVFNFRPQDVLTQKTTPSGSTLDNSGATGAINATNGAIDQLGNSTLGPSITIDVGVGGLVPTTAHYLGRQGSQQASTSVVAFQGLPTWCPPWTSRPLSGTFNNVVRGKYGVGSDGWAIDARNRPINDGINALASQMAQLKNGRVDLGVCNPVTLGKIAAAFDVKSRSDYRAKGDPEMYFDGVDIMTGAGKIEMFAEPGCPQNQIFLTKADNWVFGTPTGGNPFRPQGTGGKLFIDSYDHDRARCAVVCQGFLYPRIMSAVGNVLINA
jgi:hypothetical protein